MGRDAGDRLAELAAWLRRLHVRGDPLVLPNAWDVASARMVEGLGFPIVATSSAAVAATLGVSDDDSMGAELALAAVARIATAVKVPVSADVERGYGLAPAELIRLLLGAGAVGCNLEDSDHHGRAALVDIDQQVAYLTGLRSAATAAGVPVVVNARVDVWLHRRGNAPAGLAEGLLRAAAYLGAGADCVYPIMLSDPRTLRAFVERVGGPVNVLLGPGTLGLRALSQLGVARVSLGAELHRVALGAARSAAQALIAPAGRGTAP
ncbi:MAG TPA: isocitrate lyase/phosphoenolpyruvate mutase family protein [Verrucomicrobiae bacterium]|nr:isocitrate lyase/phosphoenolpyruvate mutase family protein [Verrucomicrobiae bacterium]